MNSLRVRKNELKELILNVRVVVINFWLILSLLLGVVVTLKLLAEIVGILKSYLMILHKMTYPFRKFIHKI